MAEKLQRPRGARVNPERRQRSLHPDHRAAQLATLESDDFHKNVPEGEGQDMSVGKKAQEARVERNAASQDKPPSISSADKPDIKSIPPNNITKPGPSPVAPVDPVLGAGAGSAAVSPAPAPNPRA